MSDLKVSVNKTELDQIIGALKAERAAHNQTQSDYKRSLMLMKELVDILSPFMDKKTNPIYLATQIPTMVKTVKKRLDSDPEIITFCKNEMIKYGLIKPETETAEIEATENGKNELEQE